jgi:hypothetical protein
MHHKPQLLIYSLVLLFSLISGIISCTPSTTSSRDAASASNPSFKVSDTSTALKKPKTNLTVLVLPPYDEIAGRGISPNIQKLLEEAVSGDSSLSVLTFPYSKLADVSYQNIFSKKHCGPVLDRVKSDIIIMSKVDLGSDTGNMFTNKWDLLIKIYHVASEKEIPSKLTADDLTIPQIGELISSQKQKLSQEIENLR